MFASALSRGFEFFPLKLPRTLAFYFALVSAFNSAGLIIFIQLEVSAICFGVDMLASCD